MLHPQLLQVKGQRPQKQLRADIGLAPGQKAAKSNVVFEQAIGTLYLNGAAKAQMAPAIRYNILLSLFPFLPEGLIENYLLGSVLVLDPAALCPAEVAATVLTPVPGGGHKLSVLYFCGLPPQVQLSALSTGEVFFFGVIIHVLSMRPICFRNFLSPSGRGWWAL